MLKSNTNDDEYYHLLIIPELTSKAKKYFKIFQPKEIIESEGYELSFTIENVGKNTFPGGSIKNLKINYTEAAGNEDHFDIPIPKIFGKGENGLQKIITQSTEGVAIHSGTAWIHLRINPTDNKKVKYYMLDRIIGEKKVIPINKSEWENCFLVESRGEMHQRYTNYILLILTIISLLLFVLQFF
jgi:hypothetical protein